MAVNIISSIFVWSAAIILLIRVLVKSGVSVPENKFFSWVTSDKGLHGNFAYNSRDLAAVFGGAFLFRVMVFFISICAIYIMKDEKITIENILKEYMQWDANNYERIALGGYKYYQIDGDYQTLVFQPLYSWLIRIVALPVRNIRASGLLTSWLLYSGACCFMYKLLSIDYSKAVTKRAIIFISVFPHALFFGAMMNESLLFFTSAATLYYIRRHKWYLAGIFGALAALARTAGLLLAFPAAVEWLEHYDIIGKLRRGEIRQAVKDFFKKGSWIFLMLAGTGIYLLCNYKITGEWFKFMEYEEKYWSNGFQYFGRSIHTMVNLLVNKQDFTKIAIWLPDVAAVVFVIAALIYGARRERSMYTMYLLVYFILNAGLKWPISVGRYMLCAIPAFIFLSTFTERHKWIEPFIISGMSIAFGIYLTAYFMSKQIL